MIKKVYHEGKLIPVKEWDFDKKKPKIKENKKKVEDKPMEETLPEVAEE